MTQKLSRSEIKRRFKQIETIAKEIVELKDPQLGKMVISDDLREEIALARKSSAGARKRQIKYIAKLLQDEPIDEIMAFLQKNRGSKILENQLHHEAERLRDAVINEALTIAEEYRAEGLAFIPDYPSNEIPSLVDDYPDIDTNEVRKSAYQYSRNRHRNHYRELFRIIKAAIEKQRLKQELK
ncbi:MAG: DUF615 domain-containing protein [Desulfobulbaceae bacterium]|mgnify:CR=1 FL=1|nr:MAG: DUF615 domain-containing protein [Desulfobulbaceae bacterium]